MMRRKNFFFATVNLSAILLLLPIVSYGAPSESGAEVPLEIIREVQRDLKSIAGMLEAQQNKLEKLSNTLLNHEAALSPSKATKSQKASTAVISAKDLKRGWMANIYAFTENNNALSGLPSDLIGTVAMNKSQVHALDYQKLLKTKLNVAPFWQCKGILYADQPGKYTFSVNFVSANFYIALYIGGVFVADNKADMSYAFVKSVDIPDVNYYDVELRVAFSVNKSGQGPKRAFPPSSFAWEIKTASNPSLEPAHTVLYIKKRK